MKTPHLEGPSYQNPEQVARHVWQKCTALIANPSGVPGITRQGEAIYVTVTGLPRRAMAQESIKRAVRRAFGMDGESAMGANPHPVHSVVIDANDSHVRVYLTPRS